MLAYLINFFLDPNIGFLAKLREVCGKAGNNFDYEIDLLYSVSKICLFSPGANSINLMLLSYCFPLIFFNVLSSLDRRERNENGL